MGGKNARDAKLEIVTSMDLVWVYAALVLLGRTIAMLNFVPTGYKNGLDGNVRSNPFFYETSDGKLVLYKEDGFHGSSTRRDTRTRTESTPRGSSSSSCPS